LSVDGGFTRRAAFVPALLINVCSVALVFCLALSLFLLLLGLPLFADLLEFCVKVKLVFDINICLGCAKVHGPGWAILAAVI
jgi:hypothetical protein